MRTLLESGKAKKAVDEAKELWSGAETDWDAVTWVIARDAEAGTALNESGRLRAIEYRGARSIGQSTITVLYEIDGPYIHIHRANFRHAETPYAGRA